MAHSMISLREPSFYITVIIIMLIIYVYYHHRKRETLQEKIKEQKQIKKFKMDLSSGLVRGSLTGYILAGPSAVVPSSIIFCFINVLYTFLHDNVLPIT